jgi:Ca2+-binding EF-hand superfamily protein
MYDTDGSGSVSYKEFVAQVCGKSGNMSNAPNGQELLERLRKKLKSRGAHGIIGLARNFKIMDDNHSLSLDKYEFSKAMTDFMLGFSQNEMNTLFNLFDSNKNGLIEYDEFLREIRGPMNEIRSQFVSKAFAKLDKDGNGYIDIHDIEGTYNGKFHPDVIAGKKTERQVL